MDVMPVPVVMHLRRRWGMAMPAVVRAHLMMRRDRTRGGGVLSAVGRRKRGRAGCSADESRGQEFLEVVVHIAPSLSVSLFRRSQSPAFIQLGASPGDC